MTHKGSGGCGCGFYKTLIELAMTNQTFLNSQAPIVISKH